MSRIATMSTTRAIAGVAYLERLQRTGDRIRLVSDNERYAPIVVQPDDELELYGVVVLPS